LAELRVFPDANFLVAAGFRVNGDYRKVLEAQADLYVTSEHVLTESARNLERLGLDPKPFIAELRRKFEVTSQFDLLPPGTPLRDPGDRQALAEAIGASCDLFVTSDNDFGDLFGQRVKGVLVQKSSLYVRQILSLP
jgi:predicted nucleic acid-binding protein